MKSLTAMLTCLTVISLGGMASRLEAGTIITVPTGLAAGSQYRLVFVTALSYGSVIYGQYLATSSSISTYNNDVTTEANQIPLLAALGASWYAIASTDNILYRPISAAANIGASPSSVGIYLLDGTTLVANGTDNTTSSSSLWSANNSGGNLLSPIDFTDTGTALYSVDVWTGTGPQGLPVIGEALGDTPYAMQGGSRDTNQGWVSQFPTYTGVFDGSTQIFNLYAISSVLTVPGGASTPEPATTALAALGLASLFAALRLRKQRNLLANPTDR